MSGPEPIHDHLLDQATLGDEKTRQVLLEVYRDHLRRIVEGRLDPRVSARIDPSDVVQDTLMEASRRLDDYLRERPLSYFAWLCQLAARLLESEP